MATSREYEQKIRSYQTHTDLLQLWQAVENGATASLGWESGKAFEYLIVRAFELEGAEVRYPYLVQTEMGGKTLTIEEIDGVVYSDGIACLLQSKQHTEHIDIEPIAKLRRQVEMRPRDVVGALFSFSGFTEPAVYNLMQESPQTVILWDGSDVKYALDEYIRSRRGLRHGLKRKYQMLVEYRRPYVPVAELL